VVRLRRIASVVLVVLIAAVATDAAAAHSVHRAVRAPGTRITARVSATGVYEVSVAVAVSRGTRTRDGARRTDLVKVTIGHLTRRVRARVLGRRVHLSARLKIRRRLLVVVRAVGQRGSPTPRLYFTGMRRLRGLHRRTAGHTTAPARHRPAGTAAPPATPAAGPTGSPTASASANVTAAAVTATGPPSGSTGATGSSAATSGTGTGQPAGAPGPPGNPSTWHVVFDDEFTGTTLDTSKWSTGWFGSGVTAPVNPEELQCYDPGQVVVTGGELDLNLAAASESCGGVTRPYISGLVNTDGKFSYTYGYVEARVFLPGTGAITDWPAVWADGQSWPADGELDVLEGLGGLGCWHFHDLAGAPGGCLPGPFTGGWHTFGADWEPGSVTYYYDGLPVGSVTSGVTASPMFLILDLAVDNSYGGAIQAPATMHVDYVRVWQH
jgi:beta-glucanase (GH16 family)